MTASRLTTPPSPTAPPSKQAIADLLTEARERTFVLISGLSDEDLHRQHDPLMSPIIWDVGHIAHFEELWLTQNLDGAIEFSEMPGMYNPFEHPRATRASLALPTLAQMTERLSEIRSRVFDRLESLEWNDANPLLKDGYVYNMVLQHEYQHNETILQTLQLKKGEPYRAPRRIDVSMSRVARTRVDGNGTAWSRSMAVASSIGTNDRSAAYDNERPQHEVDLRPLFYIDRTPVTNSEYLEFIADGGYERSELWSDCRQAVASRNRCCGSEVLVRRMAMHGSSRTMDVTRAGSIRHVQSVTSVTHEAEAFASWAGKRLPTEIEWEVAASWDPFDGACADFSLGRSPRRCASSQT